MPLKGVLVIGYGNPGRRDDGLGPALVEALEASGLPGVDTDATYQLNIEDGAAIAAYRKVIFVDASVDAAEPFEWRRITAAPEIAFSSHAVSPEAVLAVCEEHFHSSPEAWVLAIRGYDFEFAEGLSPQARENCNEALDFVKTLIRFWREETMESKKKTILAIDDDPDIRAALRVVLEAAGFSVGEAANGEEGLEVANRIKPDAVICDLMMETVDSGSTVALKLRESGYDGPIYMLSSAGDAVQYNLDARALGLSGIFQKPIEPKTLVKTLKAELLGE